MINAVHNNNQYFLDGENLTGVGGNKVTQYVLFLYIRLKIILTCSKVTKVS